MSSPGNGLPPPIIPPPIPPHIEQGIELLRHAQKVADGLAAKNGTSRDRVMVPIKVIDKVLEIMTGGGAGGGG